MNPEQVILTDALIVGAGPVGLFQVFQLGLLEMGAQVVDSLPQPGGQCSELYADKPIYDIPGLPVCSGHELTERLLQQAAPFRPGLHLDQEVRQVRRRADGRFDVETSAGTRFDSGVVIVAAGVGAFQPRSLKLAGLEAFHGTQVLHRTPPQDQLAGQQLVVAGDGDAALDAVLALSATARVTLLHRRDEFRAQAATVAQMRQACAAGRMQLLLGQPIGIETAGGRLTQLQVAGADGATHSVPLDTLLVLLGLSPRLGPIADWGLALERKQVVVDPARFETSLPGLFAVGDIVHYPGKKKLILCGFHEATLAAYAARAHLRPGDDGPLQYTTTSPRLHQLLGVAPAAA
jgi:thioredoxin reductase (NADPH)